MVGVQKAKCCNKGYGAVSLFCSAQPSLTISNELRSFARGREVRKERGSFCCVDKKKFPLVGDESRSVKRSLASIDSTKKTIKRELDAVHTPQGRWHEKILCLVCKHKDEAPKRKKRKRKLKRVKNAVSRVHAKGGARVVRTVREREAVSQPLGKPPRNLFIPQAMIWHDSYRGSIAGDPIGQSGSVRQTRVCKNKIKTNKQTTTKTTCRLCCF